MSFYFFCWLRSWGLGVTFNRFMVPTIDFQVGPFQFGVSW